MSAETDALIAFLQHTGVPHRVTSTTGGVHVPTSYHYRGLAVDFSGPIPSRDSPQLLAIFTAFTALSGQLAELIYAGAPYNIKRGQKVPLYSMSIHHNHVHVAVERGFRWGPPSARPVLRRGARGPDVVYLQSKLGIMADGFFWTATEVAVRNVQRAHGLVVDGVVGPKTWGVVG